MGVARPFQDLDHVVCMMFVASSVQKQSTAQQMVRRRYRAVLCCVDVLFLFLALCKGVLDKLNHLLKLTTLQSSLGYGVALIVAMAVSFVVGTLTLYLVKGSVDNFFVAGRSMPLFMVAFTIGAQSLDSNALLGNVDLSYRLSFWDGTNPKDKPVSSILRLMIFTNGSCCFFSLCCMKTRRCRSNRIGSVAGTEWNFSGVQSTPRHCVDVTGHFSQALWQNSGTLGISCGHLFVHYFIGRKFGWNGGCHWCVAYLKTNGIPH
jgi:hypothetical protein